MEPRRERERPAAVLGLGLALALALLPVAPGMVVTANAAPPRVTTIYHKNRNFRIPFNVDPADRPRLKEVQLWVSDDTGYTWKTVSRTTPDRPAFTFRASRDGEFWFAVRTVDSKGNLYPSDDEKAEPSMKVVVDTTPPSLVLEPDGRRGSVAAVRWEVKDEHLDLKTLALEYQAEAARDWRQLPITRLGLIGSESWDAGTAEPLKVRASVSDKAGNYTETIVHLSEGTPSNPAANAGEFADFSSAPAISQISSGPRFPMRDEPARPSRETPNAPGSFPFASSEGTTSGGAPAPTLPPMFGNEGDPFADVAAADPSGASPSAPTPANLPAGGAAPEATNTPPQTLLVASPKFPLQYAVDEAGPNGPATVELWVTQNGGRTWSRRGEDPDRVSPIDVDLGGEGTFGIRLVARAASGLGDTPPANGDAPHLWVEVDTTPPRVQMAAPVVGTGKNLGMVAIQWRTTELHLAPKPVVISWRPDEAGARWQPVTPEPIENSGKFIWTVPATVPPKFHVRVDVVDTVGNRGFAETAEGSPVVVDRARPRSRIIGLDPSAKTSLGPSARLR